MDERKENRWGGASDLAPVALLGERQENGVTIKRYAPGWAIGITPGKDVQQGIESRGFVGATGRRGKHE